MWQKYKFPNHARIVNHSRSISWPVEQGERRRNGSTMAWHWQEGREGKGVSSLGFSVYTRMAPMLLLLLLLLCLVLVDDGAWCLNQQIIFRPRPLVVPLMLRLLLLTSSSPKISHDLWQLLFSHWNPIFSQDNKSKTVSSYNLECCWLIWRW